MILSVENLKVAYGRVVAVDGLSFSLEAGEALAILGPNGAGKTTAAEAIVGLLPKLGGRVRLDQQDITRFTADRVVREGLALVSQYRDLFPDFSVEETLLAAAPAAGRRGQVPLGEIYDLFPKLAERRRQLAGTLSGGEQQMLAIGRALVVRPKVIILDEPSAGLAVGIVDALLRSLQRIRTAGLTCLIIEQNIELAERVADRCVVMSGGRATWEGATKGARQNSVIVESYFG